MEPTKPALPQWLPWAAVAGLAAAVACVGELWQVERARTMVAQEEADLAKAALHSSENQLEAEHIVAAREWTERRPGTKGFRLTELLPRGGGGTAAGALVWIDSEPGRADLRLSGLAEPGAGRVYRLWLASSPETKPEPCGTFQSVPRDAVPVTLPGPVAPGSRFLLADQPLASPGGVPEAPGSGSIVLASLPIDGSISER